ncbi:MAG: hypothetical protein HY928_11640 [Elusimicrobia bacterium]|nr:hypothetical protein [Elusimicrobiota bacterium]
MADPRIVSYIRENVASFGRETLRKHLLEQGVSESDLREAMEEAAPVMPPLVAIPAPPPPGALPPTVPLKRRKASRAGIVVGALCGGLGLMALSFLMGRPEKAQKPADPAPAPTEPSVFRGSYEFILKLPAGYRASGSFRDAEKTMEVVYVHPSGTDPQHFINDGLYEHLGILRLEVIPRRVPQGFVGMDTLKEWVTHQLDTEKATYAPRTTVVNGMPAFIVTVEKPFQYRKAYIVGDKVRYTLIGGHQNPVFDEVLSTLAETGGHSPSE